MTPKRYLVTGACGFCGRHLVRLLRHERAGVVFGLDVAAEPDPELDGYIRCDLTDAAAVDRAVWEARPDVVFHLAGITAANDGQPDHTGRVNVGGFLALRQALGSYAQGRSEPVRVLVVGSAAEIGPVPQRLLPVRETVRCRPQGPYGRSKLVVTRLALQEPAESPVTMVVARPFNLVGPGLGKHLALGNFACQLRAIEAGRTATLRCGPLDCRRDFVDVRDAVRAYVALAEQGRPGQLYNVCSGRSHRIGDLLHRLMALAELPRSVDIELSRRVKAGPTDIYGDYTKLNLETGWEPRIAMDRSLLDLWRASTAP